VNVDIGEVFLFFKKSIDKEIESIIRDLIDIRRLFKEGIRPRALSKSSVFTRFRREFRQKHLLRKLPYLDVDEMEALLVKTMKKLRDVTKRLAKLLSNVETKTRSYRLIFLLRESLASLNNIISGVVDRKEIVKVLDDVIVKLNEAKTIIRLEGIK